MTGAFLRPAALGTALAALAAIAALPASGSAAPARVGDDEGPLAVRDGGGYAVLTGRSAVLGTVERGLVVVDESSGACLDVAVHGEDWRRVAGDRRIYGGRDLRFRIVSGACRLDVAGRDLHLSAVVRGFGAVKGTVGRVAVGGLGWRDLPAAWRAYRLGEPAAALDPPSERSLARLEIRWLRSTGMSWPAVKRTDAWRRFRASG